MGLTITAIVCAYNESRLLPACLYSLRSQTRQPDHILVINNASTDETGDVARAVPGVTVIDEPAKGLVMARETARRAAQTDIVAYIDADCRVPITWLERVEAHFMKPHPPVAVTGPYRFYDWDWSGRALVRAYDLLVAPPTHTAVHHLFGAGAILYGGNFRDDLFSVTSLKHYPYVANSDFHKPKHLYSWKTLLRCEKTWEAIARTLRANVDIALTLYRNGSWAA